MEQYGEMRNTPHVLNASSNMLGLCFALVAYLKASGFSGQSLIDECTGVAAILFSLSCFYSFLSMKSKTRKSSDRREWIADIAFFSGMFIIVVIILMTVFQLF